MSSTIGVGTSGQLRTKKNETQSPTFAIYKNKLKMDKRHIDKLQPHKSPREHREENLRYSMQHYFHQYVFQNKGHKGKNKQMGPHQNKKLLHG